jgi:two-component system, chemotaxis family, protein-glutamate methylesterase/glutaminase
VTELSVEAIVIGASAGAVQALSTLLPALPANYPFPLLVVVHVPPDRSNALVPLLQKKCRLAVKEAEDKEPVRPGVAYFAPSDYHLLVEKGRTLALSADNLVLYSRPSIDVLFESAAEAYGPAVVGVILTGANDDGAVGLSSICRVGGLALVQDPNEAYAGAMPRAALSACASARCLPLTDITPYLLRLGTE